ncbi:ABC transporter substrate-binding protein [Viridibacillus arvi]|uniref:ABC transporter substrate-binding protein n=1 Tax=Viridibacillus arvi TaxID=263475 RepID=UPI003CFE8BCD
MRKSVWGLIFVLLFIVSGCGKEESEKMETTSSKLSEEAITIVDFADREVTFDSTPEKIVTLGTGDMQIIHALGGKLVGIPTSKDIVIEDLKDVSQIGNLHTMDLEKIAILQPDVVIGDSTLNRKDLATIEGIGSKMILTKANSVGDIKKQIQMYGQLLQKENKAKELIESIKNKERELQNMEGVKPRVVLIYGAPGTYMAALPNSLSGNILEIAGGVNIASDFPSLDQYPQYAQLNAERIVEANPQYVFLMTHGDAESVKGGFIKEMKQNPSWSKLDAVKNNKIEVLPAQLFGTNPGTRVIEAIEVMQELIQK